MADKKALAIAVVSNRDHHPDFNLSLLNMVSFMSHSPDNPFEWCKLRIKTQCSMLPSAREEIFEECLESGATHILCLDDDMTFPHDFALRLAAWDKPFVAANCCRKNPKNLSYTALDMDHKMVQSRDKEGLCEVSRIGLALALIDLRVFAKIEKPHFEIKWNPARQRYLGEDMYFCDKWRKYGHKIYIDHGVSNHCGHIGSFEFRFDKYNTSAELTKEVEKAA